MRRRGKLGACCAGNNHKSACTQADSRARSPRGNPHGGRDPCFSKMAGQKVLPPPWKAETTHSLHDHGGNCATKVARYGSALRCRGHCSDCKPDPKPVSKGRRSADRETGSQFCVLVRKPAKQTLSRIALNYIGKITETSIHGKTNSKPAAKKDARRISGFIHNESNALRTMKRRSSATPSAKVPVDLSG